MICKCSYFYEKINGWDLFIILHRLVQTKNTVNYIYTFVWHEVSNTKFPFKFQLYMIKETTEVNKKKMGALHL